jgi:NitT/TauT family transport system substrate-binding protein
MELRFERALPRSRSMKLLSVSAAFVAVLCLFGSGCTKTDPDELGVPVNPKIVVQLDWVAEPEHGGFYQAEANGYFTDEGLDVTLLQGGVNAFVHQKLATNQAQFGQSDSTNTILAVANGELPLLSIAAVFHNDPSVLMLRDSNPVSTFEGLDGKTIMARPEWVFLPFLRQKYGIDFKLIPQSFGLGQFIADPNFIQQGYYIAEPYFLKKEGVTPKFLFAWDAGFIAETVIVGNRDFIARQPELTRAFLRAYIKGWRDYLTGDPTPAHEIMLKINPKVTREFLEFSRNMIIKEKIAEGRERTMEDLGRISAADFAEQISVLESLDVLKPGQVSVEDVMSDAFLPPRIQ